MRDEALKLFGFTEDWISNKIISESYLSQLFSEYQVSEDKNTEHYRAWAFAEYLKSKDHLTNDEISIILQLKDNGHDLCNLHDERIHELLYSELLTHAQLEALKDIYPPINERPFQRLYQRKLIIQRIQNFGISDEIFDQVLKSNDSEVQLYFLHRDSISLEQVNKLVEQGHNKKVRNIAGVLLKKMKKKSHLTKR